MTQGRDNRGRFKPLGEPYDRLKLGPLRAAMALEPTTTIYFIECDGRIKIGRANNVDRRLSQMRSGSPLPMRVLFTIPGTHTLEQAIHTSLWHIRHRGEWFDLEEDLVTVAEVLQGKK